MIVFIQAHATFVATTLTLISHIVFVLGLLALFADSNFRAWVYSFVYRYISVLLCLGSLAALVGSLVYSQLIGFPPCELCWVQRIFIYPQALLAGIAVWKKDKGIVDYLLPMSVIGFIVALYHSFIQWGFVSTSVLKCTSVGGECARVYVSSYGYITIPFMSLTVFAYLIALSIIYYRAKKIYEGE